MRVPQNRSVKRLGPDGAETPVTGQTKMQAAWSADTENEETSAKVASASQGQIFEQIYKPWNGYTQSEVDEKLGNTAPSYSWEFSKKGIDHGTLPTRLFIFW